MRFSGFSPITVLCWYSVFDTYQCHFVLILSGCVDFRRDGWQSVSWSCRLIVIDDRLMYFAIAGTYNFSTSYSSHLNQRQHSQEGGFSIVGQSQSFSSETFHCPDCHRTFDSASAVEPHRYSMHPYECSSCRRRFNARSTLYRHCNAKHGQNKNLECRLCGKMFAHKQSKHKHMWNVHQLTVDNV